MTEPHTLYVFGTGNATMPPVITIPASPSAAGEPVFHGQTPAAAMASCGFWKKCRFH